MFPLIGLGEVATVVVDAAVVAFVLTRWSFAGLRAFGVWLAVSAVTVALLAAVLTAVAQASGWGSRPTMVVAIACLPIWLVARALTLRRMSRSHALRRDPTRPFGWGWAIAVPLSSLVVAMMVGGLVEMIS